MKSASLVHDDELELRKEYLAGMAHALQARLRRVQEEVKATLDELLRIQCEWDGLNKAIGGRKTQGP